MSGQEAFNAAFRLDGKTALVTGGGSGIGLAIARCLAAAGAKVVIAGRRLEVLEQAAAETPGLLPHVLDLTDTAGLADFAGAVTQRHGVIDILVNNAGGTLKKPFLEATIEEFDAVFDVHVRGALELTRQLLPGQVAAGGGVVLFIASMTSFIGQPLVHGYTTAKSALLGVVRGLSAEFAPQGVRVNAVAPGWIDTALFRAATSGDAPRLQKILGRIQAGHVGTPEDIGWACAYLASPAASYVTGQTLVVDGGALVGF